MDKSVQYKKDENLLQNAFLSALSLTGNITKAAECADNMSRTNHYKWLDDEEYKKKYKIAMEEAAERLETEARRRAVEGVLEPVYYQGMKCGTIIKYSDTLLMFLLKGANPDKYADRVKSDNTNKNTNENKNTNVELSHLTFEELKELLGDEDI